MTRMLKALGLSFVAVLALSAMAATAAQAHTFKAAEAPAVLTGTNEAGTQDAFTVGGAAVECEDSHYVATQKEKEQVAPLTVVPTYANGETEDGKCHYGENAAEVTVNHCAYKFSSETKATTEGQEHAHVDVECAEGGGITIKVPVAFITFHVGEQEGTTHGVVYHNIEEEYETGKKVKAVTVIATVKNIATTCEGFGCAIIGGNNLIGEYNSTDIVTGYKDTGENLEGTTKATTQENYTHEATPIDISVVGAPSTP